jgi:hypothetical protein
MMIWETFFPAINQRDFQLLIFDSLTLWHFDRHFQLFSERTHARLLPEPNSLYIRHSVSRKSIYLFWSWKHKKNAFKEAYFSLFEEIFITVNRPKTSSNFTARLIYNDFDQSSIIYTHNNHNSYVATYYPVL